MLRGAATILEFGLMSKGAHLLNRNRAVPPVANGSMYTDYSLLNDSLHVQLYQGQRYVYTIFARDYATTQSSFSLSPLKYYPLQD